MAQLFSLGDSDALPETPDTMKDTALIFQFHTASKRGRSLISLLCAVACVWTAFHASTKTLALMSVPFAFGAVAARLDQQVRIDMTTRTVSRQITLWGLCLWDSHWRLGEFTGVATYRLPSGTPQSPGDLVHVGLRRSVGGVLAIRHFSSRRAQPCPEADAFARSLQDLTHLKFDEVAS